MIIHKTFIEGLLIIEPKVFGDERGYFFESFNKEKFKILTGVDVDFVQDNQSKSQKNVLRGLHYQAPPFAQGKLVRVIQGAVLDIAVDIRKNSPTYGKHFSIELSADNKTIFWIPKGFAHGFASLEDDTIFTYKCTDYYNPSSEGCIAWNDQDLNIDWKIESPIISEKDKKGVSFESFESIF